MSDKVNDIEAQVRKRKAEEKKNRPAKRKKVAEVKIPPKFIDECLANNEMGDGFLFAAHQKGKFIYIPESQTWAFWHEHYWKLDTKDHAAARAAVGMQIADLYVKRAREVDKEKEKAIKQDNEGKAKSLEAKAKSLRGRGYSLKGKRCKSSLEWVYAIDRDYVTPNAELDTDPYLWGFNNGVVDIRTGKLRPGQPGDKITKVTPYDWPGLDAKTPHLETLLDTSLAPPLGYEKDAEAYTKRMTEYIHRYLGHSICGKTRERAFMILYGQNGSNGKGTLTKAIIEPLGPLGLFMEPDIFLESKAAKNPDAPTSTIMNMKGKIHIIG